MQTIMDDPCTKSTNLKVSVGKIWHQDIMKGNMLNAISHIIHITKDINPKRMHCMVHSIIFHIIMRMYDYIFFFSELCLMKHRLMMN